MRKRGSCSPISATVAKERLADNRKRRWLKGGKRRAYERLKILASCRLDRLIIATGALEPVWASLRAGAQARVRKLYQASDKPLHPDAITHFWANAAASAANVPLNLPFVKQRN